VHCSLADWGKFISLHLQGAQGQGGLLSPQSFQRLHTDPFGDGYGYGWIFTNRDWGGGQVMTHAGSNTMNYAVVWVAPLRDFAVLVATNEAGDGVPEACDEAVWALIQYQLQHP
jgi:CubicO group peptidase (beta-lactamase class C family)